jgi:hypothetical protein
VHLGFDRSSYPGDSVMQSLWDSTPLGYVGAYLAPAPSHSNTAWMGKVALLQSMGWGFLPVYVGQQAPGGPGSHTLTSTQGTTDASDAAGLAKTAGFDAGAVIYLDVEVGGTLTQAFIDYINAWVNGIASSDYRPGVYCSFSQTGSQITASVGDIPVWVFHPIDSGPSTIDLGNETAPDPGNSGFGAAIAWQYRMSLNGPVNLRWTDAGSGAGQTLQQVDLDAAVCRDPSNPVFPTPDVTSLTAPSTGPSGLPSATAGDTIGVEGSDFDGVTDVAFGTVSAANVAVVSDTHIEAVLSSGFSGVVDVIVSNRWGLQNPPGTQLEIT